MEDNILTSVKQLSGIESTDIFFDEDILIYINSTIGILHQLGVDTYLHTIDSMTTWSDILPEGHLLNMVKDYIAKKVRLKFDPPTGSVMDALKQVIDELEWRINVEVDSGSDSGGLAKNEGYLIIKN